MKMESNYKLKEIDIKNRTCYYLDDIIKIQDFDIDNISIDEKSYQNILVYNKSLIGTFGSISYKSLIDSKTLHIWFDKKDGFICVYDWTRHLVSFGTEKYDSIYNRVSYLISVKSGITCIISHNYAKIKVDSYNALPLEKTMTFIML